MFSEQVAQAMRQARRRDRPLALIFLDIDNFKEVNDSLGHGAGDGLLRQVADRLTACIRASDLLARPGRESSSPTIFRLGGDEFILVLPDLEHEQDASIVARRIMGALGESFRVGSQDLFATVSIGIAVYPSDGNDVKTLLRNADSAMYHAKQKGKNTLEFYTESLTQASIERMNVEVKLRRAIEQGELKLWFQPKIETRSGLLVGAEALLRWSTSGLGAVPPARFIPVAEDTGLILTIGEWVLREACRQMQAWDAVGLPPVAVAVNVSSRQLRHGDLFKTVSDLLDESGLRPKSLELEITESAIMSDVPRAKQVFQKLSELGIRLSIDDFGTGYSSLSQLKRFPVDTLKIDRSFVVSLPEDADDSSITLAIIAMAHRLGIRVVAEGVETEGQFSFLKEHECDEVQGYLFSPPVPASEFVQFLERTSLSLRLPLPRKAP
jgi:diguanylate cyclase (GGDEF)-like protein